MGDRRSTALHQKTDAEGAGLGSDDGCIRRRWTLRLALTLAVVLAPPVVGGQVPIMGELRPGARARLVLRSDPKALTATVVAVSDSAVVVHPDRREFPLTFAWDSLASLVLGVPRSPGAGARRGALAGLSVGAALTALATYLTYLSDADERCEDCWVGATPTVFALGIVGTAGLTVGGALLGAAAPGVTWTGPDVMRVRVRSPASATAILRVGWRLAW